MRLFVSLLDPLDLTLDPLPFVESLALELFVELPLFGAMSFLCRGDCRVLVTTVDEIDRCSDFHVPTLAEVPRGHGLDE